MLFPRVIPCLLLKDGGLVKTVRFGGPTYVGDPLNTIRIFNEKEVDELVFLDITASRRGRPPDMRMIRSIASECLMPVAYGGGLHRLDQIRAVFEAGIEKVVLTTAALEAPGLVSEAAAEFGSQSVVVGIDVDRPGDAGAPQVYAHRDRQVTAHDPVAYAGRMTDLGAGEIFLNSVHREGTWSGYDLELVRSVTGSVDVPVVACGGAASVEDLRRVRLEAGASAAAAGSMFVFIGAHRAVLITYPGDVHDLDPLADVA